MFGRRLFELTFQAILRVDIDLRKAYVVLTNIVLRKTGLTKVVLTKVVLTEVVLTKVI